MTNLLPYLKNKKHVIFDYNGTILYDTDLCVEALNLLLKTHDLPPMDVESYRNNFFFPISDFYTNLGFDFSKESFDDLGRRYIHHYKSNLHRCRVYSGIRELTSQLQRLKIHTSILTALNQDLLLEQLHHFSLKDHFNSAFGLPDHRAHSKIERGHELMKSVGIAGHETIVIGDTCHDFEVAQALGADVLLLADGHQDEERLRATGAPVFNLQRPTE